MRLYCSTKNEYSVGAFVAFYVMYLFVVYVELLEGVDGYEDVPYISVDELLLVTFPQL